MTVRLVMLHVGTLMLGLIFPNGAEFLSCLMKSIFYQFNVKVEIYQVFKKKVILKV